MNFFPVSFMVCDFAFIFCLKFASLCDTHLLFTVLPHYFPLFLPLSCFIIFHSCSSVSFYLNPCLCFYSLLFRLLLFFFPFLPCFLLPLLSKHFPLFLLIFRFNISYYFLCLIRTIDEKSKPPIQVIHLVVLITFTLRFTHPFLDHANISLHSLFLPSLSLSHSKPSHHRHNLKIVHYEHFASLSIIIVNLKVLSKICLNSLFLVPIMVLLHRNNPSLSLPFSHFIFTISAWFSLLWMCLLNPRYIMSPPNLRTLPLFSLSFFLTLKFVPQATFILHTFGFHISSIYAETSSFTSNFFYSFVSIFCSPFLFFPITYSFSYIFLPLYCCISLSLFPSLSHSWV